MKPSKLFVTLMFGMSWILIDMALAVDPSFVWVRSFGGSGSEISQSVVQDVAGEVFSCGQFESTVDFDPTAGIDNRSASGSWDGFVSHLLSNGGYSSTVTIGGSSQDSISGVALDVNGNLFYAGRFFGTVDFDPTAGVDSRTSTTPTYDAFLSRINADGTYAWTFTFDGAADEGILPQRMASDPTGGIVIVGYFSGTNVDFDPSAGQDLHSSNTNGDVFVSKYLSDGTYMWSKTFGGLFGDVGQGVAVDSSGKVIVCGVFSGTADFDPGSGIDNRASISGSSDFFVTNLNSDGSYGWTYNRGSASPDGANAVAVAPDDSILVTGSFQGSIDFDPGAGTDTHNAGARDVFITKLLSDGTYVWTRSFGDNQDDIGNGITVDTGGNVLVVGQFGGGFDFDPGPLQDLRSSNGSIDVFVSLFNLDGAYGGAYTVGAGNQDRARAVAVDNIGNAVVMGTFRQTVDFDTSAGVASQASFGAEDIFLLKLHYASIETPGACCEGPVCAYVTPSECTTAGGVFQGPSVLCQDVECGGACCNDYQCQFLTEGDCTNSGGTFQGLGVTCDPDLCGGVGPAPGWSTFQHDAQRTGHSTATVPDSPVLLWSLFTGTPFFPVAPTVSPDSTILVAGADGKVVAVNSDGTLKWQVPLLQNAMASPSIRLDGNFWLSNQSTFQKTLAADGAVSCGFPNIGRFAPALSTDGSVYVTDGTDTGNPWSLYKVNADCSIAWTYHGANGVASHVALDNDGGVYVSARFGLIKLDPTDGTEDWVFPTPGHAAAPAIAPDRTIYLGYEPNFVLAVNPDGTQKWVHPFNDPDTRIASSYQSPIVDENNTLYMPAVRFFQRGALVAINAAGVEQWMIDAPYSGTGYSPAMDNEGVIVWSSAGYGGVTTESGQCADGIDNDCDDLVDCADPNCRFDTPCRCENGYCGPLETPCTCVQCGMQTSNEVGLCTDGIDNDCDGTRDCLDSDCAADPACTCGNSTCDQNENSCNCATDCGSSFSDEAGNCADNVDNDCDGDIDCFDSDCASDAACLCGDHVCTFPENPCNCAVDCGSILVGISSADASEQWRVPLTPGDFLNSSPAIGGDGTLYATTKNGYLLAFGTGCAQPPAQNPPYTYRKAIQENDIINGHQISHISNFELLPDGRVVVYAQVGGSTSGAFTELVGGGFETIFPGDTLASYVVSQVETPRYADDGTRYLGALLIGAGEVILVDDDIFVAETSSGVSAPVLVDALDWHYVDYNQLGTFLIREQLQGGYRLTSVDRFTAATNIVFTDGQLVEGVPFGANPPGIDGYGDDGIPLLCCVATPSTIVVQNGDTFAGHPIGPPMHPRRNAEQSIYFREAGEGAVYQRTPDGTQRVRRSPGDVIAGQPILWVEQYAIDDDNNVAVVAKTLGSRAVFFEDYPVAVEGVTQIDGVSLYEVRTEYPGVSTNNSRQVAFLAARTNEPKAIWVATPDSSTYDTDRDCIFDSVDNCPLNANPGQLDSDSDGVGDLCDTCPVDNPNDPDNDGICSSVDNCPSDANPGQEDANGNGVGDACEPIGCSCTTSLDCRNNIGAATLCPDDNACNCAQCQAGICVFTCARYGNATCDGAQLVDLDDILCVLGGFADFSNCPNADIGPCGGNGIINLDDILSVLAAFGGADPCGCALGDAPSLCGSNQP